MRRCLDVVVALVGLIALAPVMMLVAVVVKLTSRGPALYWSNRVGANNAIFSMPKFRTMRIDSPIVATHLLPDPSQHLTWPGAFLRRSSLDELPQLFSILKGDITLVGPRPALFNQDDLIDLRTKHGVHTLVPGLTGWAQVNGRDALTVEQKVEFDLYYLRHHTTQLDLKILFLTIVKVVRGDGVAH